MKPFLIVASLVLIANAPLFAQQRDRPVVAPVGTASISGTVVSEKNDPIRRAIVTLSGGDLPAGRATISDDVGRFAFGNLPPGRYTLTSTKAAYITSSYGARRPGRPGTSFLLTAGQQMTGVQIRMPRGAVIAGTIRDRQGDAASAVQVSVAPVAMLKGSGPPAMTVTTDDRGAYRVFGLLPGDYLVFAAPPRQLSAGDATVVSSAELDAAFRELQQRARGAGPGVIGSTPAAPTPIVPASRTPAKYGYAPVFYPATTIASDALPITVAAGEERSGVDISVDLVPMATIDGLIVNPTGPLSGVQLTISSPGLRIRSGAGLTGILTPSLVRSPGTDGRFTYTGVAPGRYTIVARTTSGGGAPTLFAVTELDVNGEDVSSLTLTLQPAMRLTGRVVFDGAAPDDLTSIRVSVGMIGASTGSMVINGTAIGNVPIPPGQVRSDGKFEVNAIIPGRYRISATIPGSGRWWLRSAIVDGRDLLDFPYEVRAGSDVSGVTLTLSEHHTELSGSIQDPSGQPVTDYFVVLFPADRALWQSERRLRALQPGSDGSFVARDLPAGDYLIAALTDVEAGDLTDQRFLEALVGASVKVLLAEGGATRQDLRVAR